MRKVTCSRCGAQLEEEPRDRLPGAELVPCPQCGETARTIQLQVKSQMTFSIKAAVDAIGQQASLFMKAVIVAPNKTSEGRLVQAVALPWFEIIQFLQRNPAAAHEISPEKWEEIIAGAYRLAGFDEVTLTPRSGDFGRDIIAIKRGFGSIRVIDQVKAYKSGHLVTYNDVRAMVGVVNMDRASKGYITTTSKFAPRIMQDELLQTVIPTRLELVDGTELMHRLEALVNQRERFFPS